MGLRPLILGLGNGMCGDDAVGPVAATELVRNLGDAVQVAYDAAPLWDLAANGAQGGLVVIIDAAEAAPRFPVGRWRKIRFPQEAEVLAESRLRDTHTLNVDSLLRLSEVLGRGPAQVWIYALAGRHFQLGDTPSPGVLRAMVGLVRQIEADILGWIQNERFTELCEPLTEGRDHA